VPKPPETLSALAAQSETPTHVVHSLYNEEFAALEQHASVKSFIGVLATKRVKRRLKASRKKS
jgi:hypothetical protein